MGVVSDRKIKLEEKSKNNKRLAITNSYDVEMKHEIKQVDFIEIINFYNRINDIKTTMKLSLESSMKFWNSILLKENLITIKKHGLEFSTYNQRLVEEYEKLVVISTTHKEINTIFQLYNAFLFGQSQVAVNKDENKVKNIYNIEKYLEKNSSFVIANIVDKDKLIIEKISEKIINFLGLIPTECLGQDVKILMPNFYKVRHTRFLLSHFNTGINKILNKERIVFTQNILSYSLPTIIVVKLSSSINSISYIGFIKEISVNYDFLILTKQGQIMFYSKGFYENIIKNLKKYDFNNNFIHFYCREYLSELELISNPTYEFTDFSSYDPRCEYYGYFLLHFGVHKDVMEFFKEEKKISKEYSNPRKKQKSEQKVPENHAETDEKAFRENNDFLKSPFEILLSKVNQIKRDMILEMETDCNVKYFAKKSSITLCEGEEYFILKLFPSLNLDRSVFDEDINEMEKYLIENELKEIERVEKGMMQVCNNNIPINKEDSFIINNKQENKRTRYMSSEQDKGISSDDYANAKEVVLHSGRPSSQEKVLQVKELRKHNFHNSNNSEYNPHSFNMSKNKYCNEENKNKENNKDNLNILSPLDENYKLPKSFSPKKANSFIKHNRISVDGSRINKSYIDGKEIDMSKRFNNEALNYKFKEKSTLDNDIMRSIMSTAINEKISNDNFIILRKKFLKKNTYTATYISVFINIFFFGLVCAFQAIAYKNIYIVRKEFSSNINFKYLAIVDLIQDFTKVKSNLDYLYFYQDMGNKLNDTLKTPDLEGRDLYVQAAEFVDNRVKHSKLKLSMAEKSINTSLANIINFDKSYFSVLLDFLNNRLPIEILGYNYNYTIRQVMDFEYTNLQYLKIKDYNIELIKSNPYDNAVLSFIQNIAGLLQLRSEINTSMQNKFVEFQNQGVQRNMLFYVIIGLLSLLSFITFLRIVYLYQVQNKRISLLLSLDDRVPKELIKGIRKVNKFITQKTQQEYETSEIEENIDSNDKEDLLKEDEAHIEISSKLAKRNKSIIWQINWEIYVQVMLILAILTIIALIPIIYITNNSFYDLKFNNLLDFLRIFKINQINTMLLYGNFYNILTSTTTSDRNRHLEVYKKITSDSLNIEYQNSKILYDVVDGLNNTDNFKSFYSKEVCVFTQDFDLPDNIYNGLFDNYLTDDRYIELNNKLHLVCTESEKELFKLKGYKYLENLFYSLIDDIVKRRNNTNWVYETVNSKIPSNLKIDKVYYQIYNDLLNKDIEYLDNIWNFMYFYANKQFNLFYINTLYVFLNMYISFFLSTFSTSIVLIFFYLLINVILINNYNYSVNVEIKKLFSLLPNVVIYNNEGIYDLFTSS